MTDDTEPRVTQASREIQAPAATIFELIADPSRQPEWDGNDNLTRAEPGQRVRAVGEVFSMTTTKGNVRDNHVVEFVEGERIAWMPAEQGGQREDGGGREERGAVHGVADQRGVGDAVVPTQHRVHPPASHAVHARVDAARRPQGPHERAVAEPGQQEPGQGRAVQRR